MIIPPTKLFFVIHASGEAADTVINKLSPTTAADINEAIIFSEEYTEDIQASNEMDVYIDELKRGLAVPCATTTTFNPLFVPAGQEKIDEVLDGDPESENFRFTGMDNSPFTIKSVGVTQESNDVELIHGRVACHEFQLPSYREILEAQKQVRFN